MSLVKQGLLIIVIAALAALGWLALEKPETIGLASGGKPEQARERGRSGRIPGLIGKEGAVNVVAGTVEVDKSGETVTALGTAKAVRSVTLFSQVTGVVADVPFTPGTAVQAGDVLVHLQDDEQTVAVEKAKIALDQARRTLERQQALAKSKTISSATLLDAETAARLAEVELKSAEIDLSRRTITAPFSGMTGLTDMSAGDFVTTSTALTTLDDLSTMRVEFEVPERFADRVKEGEAITAAAQGMPGSKFSGHITGIDSRIDDTTRTLRLQAELANEDYALKAGMAIIVSLDFPSEQELAVPSLSVQWDRRGSFVWKIVEGAARRAEIAILRRQAGLVVVKGDVAAGDKVVVEGVQRLRDGAKVAEVDEAPAMADDTPTAAPAGAAKDESGEPAVSGTDAPTRTRS